MLIAQKPTIKEEVVAENRSKFYFTPLEPGFGYTLGNSLRRTLLSSIPGAAITSVKFDGVTHEFSTIAGVKEDVVEIILNIKNIVVSSTHDEPVEITLKKTGPGKLTAKDIKTPTGIEVHNKDLYIATLDKGASLSASLIVERGRGYVSSNFNKKGDEEVGRIPIDSIYSPVLKVRYSVEATRVEQRTDFDKLIIDVETKNSLTPAQAIASAGSTLVELFTLVKKISPDSEGIEIDGYETDIEVPAGDDNRSADIRSLELSQRTVNALSRTGINTVAELVSMSRKEISEIRNFGEKSVDELDKVLQTAGLSLRD
ncbi:MAG: DNA-directed RNA polymerase subunit alpha [Bifidobacteriaceae bacterium]|jgi:DNA-directed RNA polymerase subunit alpha|nr:DNA-directed RNA polymerase subunit alpha [Bifidobacteriaceae bacterium]